MSLLSAVQLHNDLENPTLWPTMPQVECPAVTPEVVLRASGHVERFTDLMVTDVVTHDCHRADHLLEHKLEAMLEDAKKPVSPEQRAVRPFILLPLAGSTRGKRCSSKSRTPM